MSHFVTCVFVEPEHLPENAAIEARVEQLMAPFDENLEMDEYEDDCYCARLLARNKSSELTEELFGSSIRDDTNESMYDRWKLMDENTRPDWTSVYEAWTTVEKSVMDKLPLVPDSTCEECKGTGKITTTYNPNSKWDWWVVGGRWDGWLTGMENPSKDNGFNFGEEHHTLGFNSQPATKCRPDDPPFAFVLDGEWHEQGKMGWFGMSSDEMSEEDWKAYWEKHLKENPNHLVVAVDCHI